MRLARTASLVVLLLLMSAAPAFAACAWVLWTIPFAPAYEFESAAGTPQGKKRVVENALTSGPYVRGAYPTGGECLRAFAYWLCWI